MERGRGIQSSKEAAPEAMESPCMAHLPGAGDWGPIRWGFVRLPLEGIRDKGIRAWEFGMEKDPLMGSYTNAFGSVHYRNRKASSWSTTPAMWLSHHFDIFGMVFRRMLFVVPVLLSFHKLFLACCLSAHPLYNTTIDILLRYATDFEWGRGEVGWVGMLTLAMVMQSKMIQSSINW